MEDPVQDPIETKTQTSVSDQYASVVPATGAGPAGKKPPAKPVIIAVVAACVLLAVGLVAAAFLLNGQNDWLDPNASQGRYDGWSEQDILDDLDKQVEEGMMAVSISSAIVFDNGTAEGEARIENVPGNRVDQKIVITLDDTGEEVYASKALAPGTHVQTIRLSRDLEPGDYAATAMFTGYDSQTHAERGSAGVQVTLHVLN